MTRIIRKALVASALFGLAAGTFNVAELEIDLNKRGTRSAESLA